MRTLRLLKVRESAHIAVFQQGTLFQRSLAALVPMLEPSFITARGKSMADRHYNKTNRRRTNNITIGAQLFYERHYNVMRMLLDILLCILDIIYSSSVV